MHKYKFTVIGLYDDGQIHTTETYSTSAYEAISAVAKESPDTLQIVGAVAGFVDIIPASDETGSSAFACDLRQD